MLMGNNYRLGQKRNSQVQVTGRVYWRLQEITKGVLGVTSNYCTIKETPLNGTVDFIHGGKFCDTLDCFYDMGKLYCQKTHAVFS